MKRNLLSLLSVLLALCITSGVNLWEPGLHSVSAAETLEPQTDAGSDSADPARAAAFQAYLTDLQDHQSSIRNYNWQMGDGVFHYPAGSEPSALKPVALADILGDETPELLYLCAPESHTADLRILGMDNGSLKELCSFPQWDAQAASGTHFALFQTDDEKTLYGCSYIGDESGFYSWYAFHEKDGTLQADKIASSTIHYADYESDPDSFTVDGAAAGQEAYDSFTKALISRANTTLLYSANPDIAPFFKQLLTLSSSAMSYDEAVLALYGQSSAPSGSDSSPEASLFSSLSGLTLVFSSGAGAWSSELVMEDGGRFALHYHDSDMGSFGEGYDSTLYQCEATGRFDQVQQLDDTVFSMHLSELTTENEPGSQWITEENGTRLLHIASDPYGLTDTESVTVYMPGTPLNKISDDALFKHFYEGDVLNGVVILGEGDFFTDQLPAAVSSSWENTGNNSGNAAGSPDSEPVSTDTDGLIFSDSSDRLLTDADISGLTPEQIQTAVNEIYARHGYAFKTASIRAHFDQYDWYRAQNTDMDAVAAQFSSTESANVKLLASRL